MRGGTIAGNAANGASGGGGVLVSRAVTGGTFRISNGTIYGSDAADGLRNTSAVGRSAALSSEGTAQHGTFSGTAFNRMGDLTTTNDTIHVENGIWRVPVLSLLVENRSQWTETINVQLFRRGESVVVHSANVSHYSHHIFADVPAGYYRVNVAVVGHTFTTRYPLVQYVFLSGNVDLRFDGNNLTRTVVGFTVDLEESPERDRFSAEGRPFGLPLSISIPRPGMCGAGALPQVKSSPNYQRAIIIPLFKT